MTPESQRIAIAEACGEWSWQLWGRDQFEIFAPKGMKLNWSGENEESNSMRWPLNGQSLDEAARELMLRIIPDYPHDLNAMHEAEKVLTDDQYEIFANLLLSNAEAKITSKEVPNYDERAQKQGREVWSAAAAHRAEAFLRTLGLWKDDASHLSMSASTVAKPLTLKTNEKPRNPAPLRRRQRRKDSG